LGVGLGAPDDADFGVFNDEPDPAVRAGMVDDGLAVLDPLLRGEAVVHHGEYFDVEAQLRPRPVQQPRPRIFVAGTHPRRRPLARALRWDGYFPISYQSPLSPEQLAAYLGEIERPPDWDLYAVVAPGHSVADFEAAGVT